jgi:hypothetical protein
MNQMVKESGTAALELLKERKKGVGISEIF